LYGRPAVRFRAFYRTVQVLSVLLHLAGTVGFAAPCRYCRFCCTLQVLSVLLHPAGTVCSRCSSFELLRYPIFIFRDWFRRIGMKPHGGHGRRPPLSRCTALCQLEHLECFYFLTINTLAVARDFISPPKRPDPRDLLFNGYRRLFSRGTTVRSCS